MSGHIEKFEFLFYSHPSVSPLELAHRRRSSKAQYLEGLPSSYPLFSPLFLPLVRYREEQNFRNPGKCSISYFVIKCRSANHTWRPSSKAARTFTIKFVLHYRFSAILVVNHFSEYICLILYTTFSPTPKLQWCPDISPRPVQPDNGTIRGVGHKTVFLPLRCIWLK